MLKAMTLDELLTLCRAYNMQVDERRVPLMERVRGERAYTYKEQARVLEENPVLQMLLSGLAFGPGTNAELYVPPGDEALVDTCCACFRTVALMRRYATHDRYMLSGAQAHLYGILRDLYLADAMHPLLRASWDCFERGVIPAPCIGAAPDMVYYKYLCDEGVSAADAGMDPFIRYGRSFPDAIMGTMPLVMPARQIEATPLLAAFARACDHLVLYGQENEGGGFIAHALMGFFRNQNRQGA